MPISDMRCTVSGWSRGGTAVSSGQMVMQEVDLPLIDHTNCTKWLRATNLGTRFLLDNSSFICAGELKFF